MLTLSIISVSSTERIIYRISPKLSPPTLLASPNWPGGMMPFSDVSWIVAVPSGYQAVMQFPNITQPKCQERHTSMTVKMRNQEEELMSRREDEKVEDELVVSRSFYFNMSNCKPEEGQFGAVAKIALQKKNRKQDWTWPFFTYTAKQSVSLILSCLLLASSDLLAIALGIAGAVLLMLLVLAVVCIVTKWVHQENKTLTSGPQMNRVEKHDILN